MAVFVSASGGPSEHILNADEVTAATAHGGHSSDGDFYRQVRSYAFAAYTTALRPSGVSVDYPLGINVGHMVFDTTLGIPIWWTGSTWVDATGATV